MYINTLTEYENYIKSGMSESEARNQIRVLDNIAQNAISHTELNAVSKNIDKDFKSLWWFNSAIAIGLLLMPLIFKLYDKFL